MSASRSIVGLVIVLSLVAIPAGAQTRSGARGSASQANPFTIRGFADVGGTTFTASQSFKAVFGSSGGVVFGGGVEGVWSERIFFGLSASRFTKSGHRVFVADGQTFDLGIDDQVTITPLELTAGYRFGRPRSSLVPYLGGGVGWHRYKETSTFASASDDVDETFHGYHVLGGVEFRLARLFGASAEAQWTTVPNALGQGPSSVGTAFDETNLGGLTIRGKFVIGQ